MRACIDPRTERDSACGVAVCATHDLDLFCEHDAMVRPIASSGVLVLLAAMAALVIGLCSWLLTQHLPGAVYAAIAFIVASLTTVALWRVPPQRKVATLQSVAAFTAIGVGVSGPFGATLASASVGLALVGLVGVIVGALTESRYGLRQTVRLGMLGVAGALTVTTMVSLGTASTHFRILLLSSLGMTFGFASGFVPEATAEAMRRRVQYRSRTPHYRQREFPRITRRARRLTGPLVMASVLANQLVAGINSAIGAAELVSNAGLRTTTAVLRAVEVRLARTMIRVGQTLLEVSTAVLAWWRQTAEMLDHKLLPATLPVAAFGVAAGLSYADAHLVSSYVGAGDGFTSAAWAHLAAVVAVSGGIVVLLTAAWASYGEPLPEAVASLSRTAIHFSTAGLMMLGAFVLAADFGLPAAELLPVLDRVSSNSPYAFGPVATITLVGGLWVLILVFLSPDQTLTPTRSTTLGLRGWLDRLSAVLTELEPQRLTVPLLTVIAATAVLVVGTAALIAGP